MQLSRHIRLSAEVREALAESEAQGIKGRDVTPFLLAKVKDITGGDSLKSNIARCTTTRPWRRG